MIPISTKPTKTNHKAPSTKPHTKEKTTKRWLSPSAINAYFRCPRSFFYSKISKLKQKPSIYLIRGIAVHSAIEQFYKHNINRCANMDYSELRKIVLDLLKDEWLSQKKDVFKLNLTKDEVAFYFHESKKMMINFLHDFLDDHGFEKPAPILEKTLFSKKHMLLGRIDAIYNNRSPPLLIDFKTSKSKELTDDYKRQLGIYALLYKINFNAHPIAGIHFLKFQNGLKKFRISDNYIRKIESIIQDIHNKTQSENIEDYPCTCGWCNTNFEVHD